jgi:predicted nucleic acid-binding Zn ribbon protein
MSVGAFWLLYQLTKRLGIGKALGRGKQAKLYLWMLISAVIGCVSRLSATRLAQPHAACDILRMVLRMDGFCEDDLYNALDWLDKNKKKKEQMNMSMRMSIKLIIGWMILSMVVVNYPGSTLCNAASLYAQVDLLDIKTRHKPEVLSTPEKDIPLTEVEKTEKKGFSKWVLIGLGLLAVGVAAFALGGGNGGGANGGGDDGNGTADVSITW